MDLKTLLIMFITFTVEMLVASIMLIKHPLRFRFKPYISLPFGILMASSTTAIVIIGLYCFCKPQQWNEALNIVSYVIPLIGIFGGLLFAYKISIPKLILLLSVAYTFQHMAYQWGTLWTLSLTRLYMTVWAIMHISITTKPFITFRKF